MAEIALDYERASDVELCRLVVRRDPHAVRLITSRYPAAHFADAFAKPAPDEIKAVVEWMS